MPRKFGGVGIRGREVAADEAGRLRGRWLRLRCRSRLRCLYFGKIWARSEGNRRWGSGLRRCRSSSWSIDTILDTCIISLIHAISKCRSGRFWRWFLFSSLSRRLWPWWFSWGELRSCRGGGRDFHCSDVRRRFGSSQRHSLPLSVFVARKSLRFLDILVSALHVLLCPLRW